MFVQASEQTVVMSCHRKKLGLLLWAGLSWAGCKPVVMPLNGTPLFCICEPNQTNIGIAQTIPLNIAVNNPYNHTMEFNFSAERGQITEHSPGSSTAKYTAPFSGGEDTIRVTVYDRNAKEKLPQTQQRILVFGDGVAFVELSPDSTKLVDTENGTIKVTGIERQVA